MENPQNDLSIAPLLFNSHILVNVFFVGKFYLILTKPFFIHFADDFTNFSFSIQIYLVIILSGVRVTKLGNICLLSYFLGPF
jgi:hypothetical protein